MSPLTQGLNYRSACDMSGKYGLQLTACTGRVGGAHYHGLAVVCTAVTRSLAVSMVYDSFFSNF